MILETAFILNIATFVGEKLLDYAIQESPWLKRKWYSLFPPKTSTSRLINILEETIKEFAEEDNRIYREIYFPFYKSQSVLDVMSKYILFDKKENEMLITELKQEIQKNSNIIEPSDSDLFNFYELFVSKINKDKELRNLFYTENYQGKIFEIKEKIDTIISNIDEVLRLLRPSFSEIIEALNNQVSTQLQKQISSGKYIPDTFIETNELKDHIRYFIAPSFFSNKIYDEINNFTFENLNRKLQRQNKNIFDFNIRTQVLRGSEIKDIDALYENVALLRGYLETKQHELVQMANNADTFYGRKIRDSIHSLDYLQSKIFLITENAGQGKTNLVCDLVDTVLLRREIFSILLTGYELDASNLYATISSKIFPGRQFDFSIVFDEIEEICIQQNKQFILIIDGLNENSKPQILSDNIESFLLEILKYSCIKVILTCRTEYFKQNFSNIEKNRKIQEYTRSVTGLHHHFDENHKERLFDTYMTYFGIQYQEINGKVYEQLINNFLLLRIFSEVYKKQQIGIVSNIYKDELFKSYYDTKTDEVNIHYRRIGNANDFDIRLFFKEIIKYMVDNNIFENIPLDYLLEKTPQYYGIYNQFIDGNVMIRRDIENVGVFGNKEVVNFTFDEFRDFMLTDYLLNDVYSNSKDDFYTFINNNLNKKSRIREGCGSFFFYMSRKKEDTDLNSFMQQQDWYRKLLPILIFDVEDKFVNQYDRETIKEFLINGFDDLLKDTEFIRHFQLFGRFNLSLYIANMLIYKKCNIIDNPNLNISILLDILHESNDVGLENFINKLYPPLERAYSSYGENNDPFEKLLKILTDILENDKPLRDEAGGHNVFLFIMYLLPFRYKVKRIYAKYWEVYKNDRHFKIIEECNSPLLKKTINEFKLDYEISI